MSSKSNANAKPAAETNDAGDVSTPGRTKVHQSVDLTDEGQTSEPKLPAERDETAGMTGGIPSPTVQQAHKDVEHGLEDTSRGAESDDAYHKLRDK